MKPFRWAFLIASLFFVHGWMVEHQENLRTWVASSEALDVLLAAAQALLGGPTAIAVGLFVRVHDADVLRQPTRQRIHSYVLNNPGVSLSEISNGVGIGWGTTVHHLERLESAHVLRSYSDGRRRAFRADGPMSVLGDANLPRTDPCRARLLAAIRGSPGVSQGELARQTGMSLALANRHLRVLERLGLVVSTKTWRTRTYRISPDSASQTSPLEKRARDTLSSVSPRGTSSE